MQATVRNPHLEREWRVLRFAAPAIVLTAIGAFATLKYVPPPHEGIALRLVLIIAMVACSLSFPAFFAFFFSFFGTERGQRTWAGMMAYSPLWLTSLYVAIVITIMNVSVEAASFATLFAFAWPSLFLFAFGGFLEERGRVYDSLPAIASIALGVTYFTLWHATMDPIGVIFFMGGVLYVCVALIAFGTLAPLTRVSLRLTRI